MMLTRSKIGALLLALAVAAPAQAALDVDTVRIAHGVRAWYVESPTVPVVDVKLSFEGAGYASDPAGQEGRAALLAAMLTEGAGEYDALGFQQALEERAIELSVSSSADRMTIHVRALREQAEQAGALLALALKEPRFDASELARVKIQTTTMLKRLNESAGYRAGRLLAVEAFAGHPYANPPYGTARSVNALSADDLRRHLATYLTRSNVKIAAAGDVDGTLLDAMLEPVVDALGSNQTEPYVAPVTLKGAGSQLREAMPVPQTSVQFAAPGIDRGDKRFYAASILNHALGGDGLIARLARGVRQDKGLAYGIGTDLESRRGVALISGSFATRNASAAEGIAAVKAVLTDLRDRGLTQQECDDARTYVLGSQLLRLDSSDDVSSVLLSMQIYGLGQDYLKKREAYIRGVRCGDVNTLARELLDPSRFVFAVVGGTDAP